MMSMNFVIQERRKELGLTQEQVAEYLNVSVPAVCKWEKGVTSPDISLLPSLARLLQTDLNTLFCFKEDLNIQEISNFSKEMTEIVREKGIAEGFEAAKRKIRTYPYNETLLHCLALQLDGLLLSSGLSEDEMRPFYNTITGWYQKLMESDDSSIRSSVSYMMASRLIRAGEYDEAQKVLDTMPSKDDILSTIADKKMLQIAIYLHQGETEKATQILQNALLMSLHKVQMLLIKLVDTALVAGDMQKAEAISIKSQKMAELFDLWKYNSGTAPLQVALAEKDTEKSISILRYMLSSMLTPWEMEKSPLFDQIAQPTNPKTMLPAILSELESSPGYAFLRECNEFQVLITQYRAFLK